MKKMMNAMSFKSSALKANCENEPHWHKYKLIGFAFLMATISGTW